MLDIGASNENSPDELVQFALMGSLYVKSIFGVENPKVYLLSNGTESCKGSPTVKEAYKLLENATGINFCGNIEAREVLSGEADVVVCDGFTGNIALKAIEGTGNVVKALLKDMFTKSFKNKLAYLLVKKDLKKKLTMLSSKPLGGAMFIGLKKVVVKAHGNSDAIAFKNALETAYRSVKGDLVGKISKGARHE